MEVIKEALVIYTIIIYMYMYMYSHDIDISFVSIVIISCNLCHFVMQQS